MGPAPLPPVDDESVNFPSDCPRSFRATVHGTIFADRECHLEQIRVGDDLTLRPDPPVQEKPEVWVHLTTGEPVGHLPPEIAAWLAPWMLQGGCANARALRVSGAETPSWRRLLVEVSCP